MEKTHIWIYLLVAFGIVLFDMLKLCRFIECRHIPV